jgi:PAS domain S-box-containing protein
MSTTRPKISQTLERLSLAFSGGLVLFIGILTYHSAAAFRLNSEQAVVSRQVVDRANALLSSLKDAETGQRGFLLTGDDRYLEPYRQATAEISSALEVLARMEADRHRADQVQRVERLRPLVKDKLDELTETIELRRAQGPEAALVIVRTNRGKAVMDRIRTICAEIQATANGISEQQTEETRTGATRTGLIAVLGSAAIFGFLVFATVSVERGSHRRQQLIGALEKSEDQLRQSRDWLQTTVASIGDAVITTDKRGKITLLNAVAQSVTGWKNEEAAGKPLEQVFVIRNEETGLEVESPVTRVLRQGTIVGLANHTILVAKDGRHVPIDDSAAPIRDGGGQIAGVVLVFRDISQRKVAEEALRLSNAALLRANEDLSQFAFAASHDLQEPLRMITSYSQLLLKGYRGQIEGEAAICIEFIIEGNKRMRALLADLLAYTQVAGDKQEAIGPVDLNQVLQAALKNCQTAIDEAGAVIASDNLPTIPGYEPHFVQLFQNLISNGLKYRSQRAPRIQVSANRQEGVWHIAVQDNGIGIAPEYHKQIFGVFKRLHGHTIPGTGIGLAICKRVVDRYGGQIWVESQVDRGSTFHFTVPATAEGTATHGG